MSHSGTGNKGKWTGGSLVALLLAAGAAYFGVSGDDGNSASNAKSSSVSSSKGSSASTENASASSDSCSLSSLPQEVTDQVDDILTGAEPDDGEADGKHFGNYEGILPKKKSSYYREYTVKTPGLNHRGERRIVVGGGTDTDPDVWYYSDDHFKSFCEIPDAEN